MFLLFFQPLVMLEMFKGACETKSEEFMLPFGKVLEILLEVPGGRVHSMFALCCMFSSPDHIVFSLCLHFFPFLA